MTYQIKVLYDSALKCNEFLMAIYDADGDKKPNMFSSEIEKHGFAAVYYGWLVGKYGNEWRKYL